MEEVKSPKKPLIYYYVIVLLVILLFNMILTPRLMQGQVLEVDYGTFMRMADERNIGTVQMDDTQILFSDKDNTVVFRTGVMDDPELTERLYESGAVFSKEIVEPASPLMSFFLNFVLPLLIFFAIGQYFSRKLMQQVGGKELNDVRNGEEQCKSLRPVNAGHSLLRCGRRG